jgi:hypothetical protein
MEKNLAILTATLLGLSCPAYSGGIDYLPAPAVTEGGFFFGGGLGVSQGPEKITVDSNRFPASAYQDINLLTPTQNVFDLRNRGNTLFTLEVGYNFNAYVGLFFDYIDWGNQELLTINGSSNLVSAPIFAGSFSSSSFGPGIIAYYPIASGFFDFFASLGVEFLTSTLKFTIGDPSSPNGFNIGDYSISTSNATAMAYTCGGQMNFRKYFSIRLEYKGLTRVNDTTIGAVHYNAFLAEGIVNF